MNGRHLKTPSPPLHAPSPRLFLLLLNMGNVLTGVDRPFLHVWFRPIQINVDIQPTTEVCAGVPRCHSPLFPSDVRRRQWRLTCDPIWIDFPMTESFWEGERQGGTDTPFPSLSPSSLFFPANRSVTYSNGRSYDNSSGRNRDYAKSWGEVMQHFMKNIIQATSFNTAIGKIPLLHQFLGKWD